MKNAVFSLLLALPGVALAEADAGTFRVQHYAVQGLDTLSQPALDQALQAYTGDAVDFATVQDAVAALERYLRQHGHAGMRVLLPEQEIVNGEVRLQVLQTSFGNITLEGNHQFDQDNIRRSLPALQSGAGADFALLDRQLRLANENVSKQTTVRFRPGRRADSVDATITVAEQPQQLTTLILDNSGSQGADGRYATGRYRSGVLYQHNNVANRDQAFSLYALSSPDYWDQVSIIGLGYQIPLYSHSSVLRLSAGYANVDSGKMETLAGSYNLSGSGQFYAAKMDTILSDSDSGWARKLRYGIEHRLYSSNVNAVGSSGSLVPDIAVTPLSLGYAVNKNGSDRELGFSIDYFKNLALGSRGGPADFAAYSARTAHAARYDLWRYKLSATRYLGNGWALLGRVQGQWTDNALVSGEQFGIGGADSVRGFNESALSSDIGHSASMELQTRPYIVAGISLRSLLFVDGGWLRRNAAGSDEVSTQSLWSYGLGLRAQLSHAAALKLDYAIKQAAHNAGDMQKKYLHASMSYTF